MYRIRQYRTVQAVLYVRTVTEHDPSMFFLPDHAQNAFSL